MTKKTNRRDVIKGAFGAGIVDGKPLQFGNITFIPEGGRQSIGNIEKDGSFKLTCFQPGDGALIGKHKIAVTSTESLNRDTAIKYYIPLKYSGIQTSGLTEEIKSATDSLVTNLT